jgi:NAD(P)-dependent dehydrogenase (short-subunit alcohol dehydrogenase family)
MIFCPRSSEARMAIAVVTGGAGGIGMAICRALSAAGHAIAVVDIDVARSEAAAALLVEADVNAFAAPADVTDPEAVEAMARAVLGRGDVGIVVNNAGHAFAAGFAASDNDDWRRSLALNLDAASYVTRAFLPGLTARRQGVIINIASVNGVGTYGNPAYSVAKAGLIHLTRQLAVELGPLGIRVLSVVPGTVRSPAWEHRLAANPALFDEIAKFYPLRRVADPEDVAAVVAFAASDAARAMTGTELVVDCGLTAGNSMLADMITKNDG